MLRNRDIYASENLGIQTSNRLPILADEIKLAHGGVMDAAKTAAERAIEAGNALIEAKSLVKHGQWLQFLRDHCAPGPDYVEIRA